MELREIYLRYKDGGCGEVRTPDIRLVRANNQKNFNLPQPTLHDNENKS